MSIEIYLYPKRATKSSLIKELKLAGFQKTRHVIDAMNTEDMLHYSWYSFENYESIDGVEATVMRTSKDERENYKCTEWMLHTRTRASSSYEDKKKQNEIIRVVRKLYGGTFYNDHYGTNVYTNLEDFRKLNPLDKGISIVVSNSLEKLEQISNCLAGYKNDFSDTIASQPEEIKHIFLYKDPSTLLYNSLMPFLVSVLEYFFGQSFINFLKYDDKAKIKLSEEKIKIGIQDVVKILDKQNSVEQLVLETYNFQNLDSINRAYKSYLGIDIFAILSVRKKIDNKIFRILPKLQEILQARHEFVHELKLNYNLKKTDYLNYVSTVNFVINITAKAFEKKNVTVDADFF